MAERFPGSAVLGLEAEGHCIMASPSLCMARHLRAYYQTGALPDHGTICDDNEKPFIGLTKRGEAEEEELLEQLRWTASHLYVIRKPLLNCHSLWIVCLDGLRLANASMHDG